LLGNLAPIPAASLALFAALAAGGVWLILSSARELNLLALGEEAASQLGVDAERLKRRVFVAAALLTGTVVAFSGPLGFVGLVVGFQDGAFAYGRPAQRRERAFAFPGLSFAVEHGEVFGVIGPNSAGKTSLLRLLTRVLAPQRGEIRLGTRRVSELAAWELAREVAVVPQEAPRPFPFTVEQLVLMGRYPHAPRRFFESPAAAAAARAAT